jgi:hypothetical protein
VTGATNVSRNKHPRPRLAGGRGINAVYLLPQRSGKGVWAYTPMVERSETEGAAVYVTTTATPIPASRYFPLIAARGEEVKRGLPAPPAQR